MEDLQAALPELLDGASRYKADAAIAGEGLQLK
jgi:hypothetical protein